MKGRLMLVCVVEDSLPGRRCRAMALAQIDAVLGLELVGHPVDDALIPVVAAQVVVASGGGYLEPLPSTEVAEAVPLPRSKRRGSFSSWSTLSRP